MTKRKSAAGNPAAAAPCPPAAGLAAPRRPRYRHRSRQGDGTLKRQPQGSGTDREAAEAVAVEALAFVAADDRLLPRFLAITGIEASEIRRAAASPGFLAGVLQFIVAHEPTLIQFCEASGRKPEAVTKALSALPFGDDRFDGST